MQGISPSGIRDVDRPEWMSLSLGYPSECNAVVVAALLFGDLGNVRTLIWPGI